MDRLLSVLVRFVVSLIGLQLVIWAGDMLVPATSAVIRYVYVEKVYPPLYTDEEVELLALNIYHETRGLPGKDNVGWRSIAAVVFNRLEDRRFPKTIRDIVYEENKNKGTCAFSWYCDKLSDFPRSKHLHQRIRNEARKYLIEYRSGEWVDPTNGAHSYHANTVSANAYFKKLSRTFEVTEGKSSHFFYRDS